VYECVYEVRVCVCESMASLSCTLQGHEAMVRTYTTVQTTTQKVSIVCSLDE